MLGFEPRCAVHRCQNDAEEIYIVSVFAGKKAWSTMKIDLELCKKHAKEYERGAFEEDRKWINGKFRSF